MKKFINEKADINNPKWNNLIHREKEIYKRENDLKYAKECRRGIKR